MILNLIVSLLFGVAIFGMIYAVSVVTRGKIPKSLALTGGAIAVIGYQIYQEQTWQRTAIANLPDGIVEIRRETSQEFYRPWTYIWPRVKGIVAVDRANIRTSAHHPNVHIVDLFLVNRIGITGLPLIVDCDGERYTELLDTTEFSENGLPENAQWYAGTSDTDLMAAVCS